MLTYSYMVDSLERTSIQQLDKYITERGHRERSIFQLCKHTLKSMVNEYRIALDDHMHKETEEEFNAHLIKQKDGTIRHNPEDYNSEFDAHVYIDDEVKMTPELKEKVLKIKHIVEMFGRVNLHSFNAAYASTPENIQIGFWPGHGNIFDKMDNNADFTQAPFVNIADIEHNPERGVNWTGLYLEKVAGEYLMNGVVPVDIDGKQTVMFGLVITLRDFLKRTISDHLEGGYNIIIHENGSLIAHADYMNKIKENKGPIDLATFGDPHLNRIYKMIRENPEKKIFDNIADDEYFAVSKIEETGWYFIAVQHKAIIHAQAIGLAKYILFLGVCSLLLEILILYIILKRQISKPLEEFINITDTISLGQYNNHIDSKRNDEIGHLAHSFNAMSKTISIRDASLEANQLALEQKVKDRTQKLIEAHQKLIVASRSQGMSQIASNVLHKIGNLLSTISVSMNQIQNHNGDDTDQLLENIYQKLYEVKKNRTQFAVENDKELALIAAIQTISETGIERKETINNELGIVRNKFEEINHVITSLNTYINSEKLNIPTSLGHLIRQTIEDHSHADHLKFSVIMDDIPNIQIDQFKLRDVLNHLLTYINNSLENTLDSVIVFEGVIDSEVNELAILISQSTGGCSHEIITKIFTLNNYSNLYEDIHDAANLTAQLGGHLSIESQGDNQPMQYKIKIPYIIAIGGGESTAA